MNHLRIDSTPVRRTLSCTTLRFRLSLVTERGKLMAMNRRRRPMIPIIFTAVLVLFFLSACEEAPTTVVLNVVYDDNVNGVPPVTTYLYLRMMLQDGTVVWSNEAAPRIVSGLADGDFFQHILNPPDSILIDPADLYMFDAYFYNGIPLAAPPIDPTNGGDAERITREAVVIVPAAIPIYNAAPHLITSVPIVPGTQRQVHLIAFHEYP